MRIAPISCIRPRRGQVVEALGAAPCDAAELDALVKDGPYELDASRSLYLCEVTEGERSQTQLVCGCELAGLGGSTADDAHVGSEGPHGSAEGETAPRDAHADAGQSCGMTADATDPSKAHTDVAALGAASRLSALGAQDKPVVIAYPGNVAIDIILGAAKAATPLYALEGDAVRLVVWRVSRPEAVEALEAALSGTSGCIAAGQELASTLSARLGAVAGNAPLPLASLVSEAQLAGGTPLELPSGLFIRRIP